LNDRIAVLRVRPLVSLVSRGEIALIPLRAQP
jgi:hypothetical protein